MDNRILAAGASRTRGSVVLSLFGCVLFASFFMVEPAVFVLQQEWIIWPRGWWHAFRWPLLVAVFLLSGLSYRLARRAALDVALTPDWRRWIHILTPFSLLPLGAGISLSADFLPLGLVSNGLFFLPVWILSVVICRAVTAVPGGPADGATTRRWAWWLLAGTTLFFAGIGCYVSATTGEHVGDEGHYLIQAESLFKDHDLDIKNNFAAEEADLAKVGLPSLHIAPNCRGGHWYSWHPFGLSVLLAPFWPGGMPVRQLILGVISGVACAGMFLLGCRLGAGRRASLGAVLLFSGSVYWTVYSVRSLPEVLGAALLIWVFWAIAAQKDKPWISLWVAAACCIYLPFAHMRFLPLGLMGFGLYGLAGLCATGPWGRKVVRLAVFSLVCLAGATVYMAIQRQMFAGGASYSVEDVLFSYPLGAWAVLADARGVIAVLPLFMWLAAAWIAGMMSDRETRWFLLGIGAAFVACLLTSSTNTGYVGGASVPGRYALVVVPLLIPVAARMLDRATPQARWWFVFLGLISSAVLVVTLVRLPLIGRSFIWPVPAISSHPLLLKLFSPHSTFVYDQSWTCWVTSMYAVTGIGLTTMLLLLPGGRKGLSLLALVVILATGVIAHCALAKPAEPYDADVVASELLKRDLDRALVIRRDTSRATPLFEVSRHVFRDVRNPQRRPIVTTQDLGVRRVDQMLSQPRIEVNDWADRGFRWTTLTAPIDPPRGRKLIRVGGRIEGAATVVLAIREGGHTLFEGPLPVEKGQVGIDLDVPCRGKSGHLYILVRLENGEGIFYLDELYWSPYNGRMLKADNLQLPAGRVQGRNPETGRQTSK